MYCRLGMNRDVWSWCGGGVRSSLLCPCFTFPYRNGRQARRRRRRRRPAPPNRQTAATRSAHPPLPPPLGRATAAASGGNCGRGGRRGGASKGRRRRRWEGRGRSRRCVNRGGDLSAFVGRLDSFDVSSPFVCTHIYAYIRSSLWWHRGTHCTCVYIHSLL